MKTIEQIVKEIRDWEYKAGESFTDYFLDSDDYDEKWIAFIESKGFLDSSQKIKKETYIDRNNKVIYHADQHIKFDINCCKMEDEQGDWDDEAYVKDLNLWAEFILSDESVLSDFEKFLKR